MRKRLKVLTVGCKANFADSASIAVEAEAAGLDVVPGGEPADVVVVNSCTVTHRADRDSRALARRARRENPGATIILAGCYAKTAPGDRGKVPEADHWAGDAGTVPDLLREIGGGADGDARLSDYRANLRLGHRRAFLKIQDGCDSLCAYCIVPSARGRSRSEDEAGIVARAVRAEEEGAREIVLTGIHVGTYGADLGRRDGLARLIEAILARTRIARIRLSSVEPAEITERLLDVVAGNPRVCPHLHVPLQSGSDRTLARMRRPYTAAEYLAVVSRAAGRMPGAAIGADAIAGFPGETAADFEETVRLVRDSPLTSLHVFPYSRREGTVSASWADDVAPAEKKRRVARLIAAGASARRIFLDGQVGGTLEVLVESADGNGSVSGLSGNYAEVVFPGGPGRVGELVGVRIASARDGRLAGSVA